MIDIFSGARTAVANEFERIRNRPFLEATMAASALVSLSDGDVNFAELNVIDEALETVQEFKIYDPHKAVDIYRGYVDGMHTDPEATRDRALDAVAKISGDRRAAYILIRVCIGVGNSDDNLGEPEKRTVRDLCRALEIQPAEIGL